MSEAVGVIGASAGLGAAAPDGPVTLRNRR